MSEGRPKNENGIKASKRGLLLSIRNRGLVFRIIFLLIVALLVMGFILGSINYYQVRKELEKEILSRGRSLTNNQAYNAKLGIFARNTLNLKTLLEGLKDENLFDFALIQDADRAELASWGDISSFLQWGSVPETGKEVLIIPAEQNPTGRFLFIAPVISYTGRVGEKEEDLFESDFSGDKEQNETNEKIIGLCVTAISPAHIDNPARKALWVNVSIVFAAVIGLSALVSFLLVVNFRTMGNMSLMLEEIAMGGGDLTRRIEVGTQDEIGLMGRWFNRFIQYLHEMMKQIVSTMGGIESSFEELFKESQSLVSGADKQIGAVNNTIQSIEKMDDSIVVVAKSAESLRSNIVGSSEAIKELTLNTQEVGSSTEALLGRLGDVNKALSLIDPSLRRTADSIQEIRSSGKSTAEAVVKMNSAIDNIRKHTEKSAGISRETRTLADQGRERMTDVMVGTEAIASAFQEVKNHQEALKKQLETIGMMLTTIRDVSSSTNLLSLNAAIIAAQAGDQGKGFGVVASEIKELAEQSARSTKDIESVLKNIYKQSENVAQAMLKGMERVEKGSDLSTQACDVLERMAKGVETTEKYVNEIVTATKDQSASSRLINAEIKRLVGALEMISQATEEQSEQASFISRSVDGLNNETTKVQQSIYSQGEASKHLQEITENITVLVDVIYESIKEQQLESKEIVDSMDKIRVVSEHNMAATRTMDELISRSQEERSKLAAQVENFKI